MLGLVFVVIGCITDTCYSLAASSLRGVLLRGRALPFVRRWVAGAMFLGLGAAGGHGVGVARARRRRSSAGPQRQAVAMLDSLRSVLRFRPIELDPVTPAAWPGRPASTTCGASPSGCTPSGVFDYIDGAAEDERTLAANSADFGRIGVPAAGAARRRRRRPVDDGARPARPRCRSCSPRPASPASPTRRASWPSPAPRPAPGCRTRCRRWRPARSRRSPRRAATAGAGSRCTCGATAGWCKEMIERAAAAGYEALIVTVDTARARQARARRAPRLLPAAEDRPGHARSQGAVHPGWTWRFVRAEPVRFANVAGQRRRRRRTARWRLADYVNTQFDPGLSWADIDWMRSVWDGPIVLKGIQTVADARARRRARHRGDRPVEPRRPPARRRADADQPRRPGGRRGRRRRRGVLRRRRAPRQRHRQGRRARCHGRA